MTNNEKKLLLATNGADECIPALNYGIWLATLINVPVKILGIIEKPEHRSAVEKSLDQAQRKLAAARIPFKSQLQSGNSRRVIREQAVFGKNLTVIGPLGRLSLKRWHRGRSYRRILAESSTPLLYIKSEHASLKNILVCMGGLGYARSAEQWAIFFARRTGASLTIMHVVEPITYRYPIAREIQTHWSDITETNTPQGHNLRSAMDESKAAGIPTTFKVRKGGIVQEILAEVGEHTFDLVVVGSPYSSRSLRHLFLPNITAEVAEVVSCPVLSARYGQDLIFL